MGQFSAGVDNEWYSHPEWVQDFLTALGLQVFDLDPCSPMSGPTVPARQHFTKADDGLAQEWHGIVYMNPPYAGDQKLKFLQKAIEEVQAGRARAVLALLPGNTESGTVKFELARDVGVGV